VLNDLIVERKNGHPHDEIKIFTLVSDRKTLQINNTEYRITTALPSRLNHLFTTRLDYRNLIVFAPVLMKVLSRKIMKRKPNEIQISSFAIAKNISIHMKDHLLKTTLYLHSPMQYIRSHYEEYSHKLKGWKGKLFKWIAPRLRKRDKQFTQFDEVYANSNYTAQLAKEIYGLDAIVKYPKVTVLLEKGGGPLAVEDFVPLPYYVYTGRLVKFVKEVDKIIQLFNHTHEPLIIIGSGPDEAYLKSIAQKNIIFVERIDNKEEIYNILAQAK